MTLLQAFWEAVKLVGSTIALVLVVLLWVCLSLLAPGIWALVFCFGGATLIALALLTWVFYES